ncbi:uncharacterized protein LOC133839864 [Drosophila sulfurigaster albostrigata]|uniref:uncharacterized protein LOC133839864 n=1 Tax=Drosophila sulfurigaster albostrigata TaxID=89887 RepID=UPI002D21E0B0|nr:uncharacterized protein LOC133839864 [Drosophila sulfurigaster albostrigata]
MNGIKPLLTLVIFIAVLEIGNCADDDSCSDCSLTGLVYACVDEFTYGVCYGTFVVDPDSIKACPDGYYCSVEDGVFCSAKDDCMYVC